MILKLLRFLFERIIGKPNISEKQKQEFRDRFDKLLTEVVKAGAEGAVRGALRTFLLILMALFLSGCALGKAKGEVFEFKDGLVFESNKPCDMTFEKDKEGNVKASYSTKSKSILEDIIELYSLRQIEKED